MKSYNLPYWETLKLNVPRSGIICFLLCYFLAAYLYPGGHLENKYARGYDHLRNFYCDLQEPQNQLGINSQSRPIILLGNSILFLSLIPFWISLVTLFQSSQLAKNAIRYLGVSSMIAFTLLPFMHGLAVNLGFLAGILAATIALIHLIKDRRLSLAVILSVALSLGVMSYFMWFLKFHYEMVPIIQKIFLLITFTWVFACLRKIQKLHGQDWRSLAKFDFNSLSEKT